MRAPPVALTSGALTIPRRQIFLAREKGIWEGFLEVMMFKLDLEGQLDLDGQRWDGAFRGELEMGREGAEAQHGDRRKAK